MRPVWILVFACLLACMGAGCDRKAPRKVVVVGGVKSEGPARHDYPNGVRVLKALIESSTDNADRDKLTVAAYPDGWPDDPSAFDGASTIVWYFDGEQKHPLLDRDRRSKFEALMKRGVGLVALHQASTVPRDNDMDLPRWLGAARYGMFDRTTETAGFVPAAHDHPVSRGVAAFGYRDEFYPTFRFANGGKGIVPILKATLHAQYRNGKQLLADTPETHAVAWAFERPEGGRSFVFSGAHYLETLDQPQVRKMLLNAIFWTAGIDVPRQGVRSGLPDAATLLARKAMASAAEKQADAAPDMTTFHNDSGRSGWHSRETVLTPRNVADTSFGLVWESLPLDTVDGQPPRLYASPLYVDRVRMSAGEHRGVTFRVVFAASNNGFVYAINAGKAGDIAPGRILWRTRLGEPCRLQPAPLDGVATGILSTPVIDIARQRLYVTHCGPEKRWQAYALDITSGKLLPGWPVRLDEETFNTVNANAGPSRVAPTRRFDFRVQRGALNLSPDGALLYVVFGETETGWLVAVDTAAARVKSAFAAVAMPHRGSGGIWGSGGPAVDGQGNVFVVTGSGFDGYADRANDWTQSVLMLSPPAAAAGRFELRGTYTPFNYCETAAMDIDLGSGGAVLLPDRDTATTATPRLMVVAGKQGNVYLLDRSRLPGRLDRRQPCGSDSSLDASLLPPEAQPQFGRRGPLNVFGPYSEKDAAMDLARARSVPAHFRDARGVDYLFATGNTKQKEGSDVSIPPSVARLEVMTQPGKPAYLRIDRTQKTLVLGNPGSPVVTSNGPRDAIVWILDENASRSAPLEGPGAPQPVLYALDATTLQVLWKSGQGQLYTSGKYNEPGFGRGIVFVGTDRIQAFGPGGHGIEQRNEIGLKSAASARPSPVRNPVPTIAAASGAGAIDGSAIYAQRCAVCHDHPQGNIPPRKWIAARPHDRIVDALTHGAMRAQAQGLTAEQIDSVARYLK